MPTPKKMVFEAGAGLASQVLASSLYSSLTKAAAELIFNGIDAATINGVVPVIDINYWEAGAHPLFPGCRVITFLDNGTGLTPERIEAYRMVGESVNRTRSDLHGTHGVGKLAALALGMDQSYAITTNYGKGTLVYRIDGNIFRSTGFAAERADRDRVGLPNYGSFTEIAIPNPKEALTPQTLLDELPGLLPLRQWKVRVNNRPVQKRQFKVERSSQTPNIKTFGGIVQLDLGIADVTSKNDAVFLVDGLSGRIVGDLSAGAIRSKLDRCMRDPRLAGHIRVPGIEAASSASRDGLHADFWTSKKGKKLIEIINSFGVELAREILQEEATSADTIGKALWRAMDMFATAFGEADKSSWNGFGGKPKGGKKRKKSRKKKEDNDNGDEGEKKPRKKRSPEGVYITIEGTTYHVMSFDTESKLPSEVRQGPTIVINTAHPEVQRLEKSRASRAVLESTVELMIWAHVMSREPQAVRAAEKMFELKHQVLSLT